MFSFCLLLASFARADVPILDAFKAGSFQQILKQHNGEPFVLVVWSTTCPACLKEMPLLKSLHKSWPTLKMVMLSNDDISATAQVQAVLAKQGLGELENWVFAEENTQKLNYEIDPDWYGELPRTYFFDAAHAKQGVSGILSKAAYEAQFTKILTVPAKAP